MAYKFFGKEYESLEEISSETFLTIQGLNQIFFKKKEVNELSTDSKKFVKDGTMFICRKGCSFWDVVEEVRNFDFNKWGKVYDYSDSEEKRRIARNILLKEEYHGCIHPCFRLYIKRNLVEKVKKEVEMVIKEEASKRFHYNPETNAMISDDISGYRVFQCLDLTWKCVSESDGNSIKDMMIKGGGSKSLSSEIEKCKREVGKDVNGVILNTPFHTVAQGAKILGVTERTFKQIVKRAGTRFLTREVLINERRIKAIVANKIYLTVSELHRDVPVASKGHFMSKLARSGKKYFESLQEVHNFFEVNGKRFKFRGKKYSLAELYKEIGYLNDWMKRAFFKYGNLDKVSPSFRVVRSSLGEQLRVSRNCKMTAEEVILEGKNLDMKKWVTLNELKGFMGKRNQRSLCYRLQESPYGKELRHPIFVNVFLRRRAEEMKFLYERDFSEEEYVPMSYVLMNYEKEIRNFVGEEKVSKYGLQLCWRFIRSMSFRFFKSDFEGIKEMRWDEYCNKEISFYKKDELCQIVEKIFSLGYKYFKRMEGADILSFSTGSYKRYQLLAEGANICED